MLVSRDSSRLKLLSQGVTQVKQEYRKACYKDKVTCSRTWKVDVYASFEEEKSPNTTVFEINYFLHKCFPCYFWSYVLLIGLKRYCDPFLIMHVEKNEKMTCTWRMIAKVLQHLSTKVQIYTTYQKMHSIALKSFKNMFWVCKCIFAAGVQPKLLNAHDVH